MSVRCPTDTHLCCCIHDSTKKELASYIKEGEKQSAKIAKMREDGADEYDIRKQVRLLCGGVLLVRLQLSGL